MKIKICGLFREEDIDYVNTAMPDFVGFVIDYPKSHRSIDPERAKQLKGRLNPKIKAVGVFVDAGCDYIAKMCQENTIDMVQLHGNEDDQYIRDLKMRTDKKIIKAFLVGDDFKPCQAEKSLADYILLDGGRGSGKTFSYEKISSIKRKFFLAGGLSAENIVEASGIAQAFALDMSSGLETGKLKDLEKIISAVKQAHRRRY